MPVPNHLDQDLLQKLLLGQLPSSEVERLAKEYANDDRLSELAESVAGTGDTLLELLHNHETVVDPEGERLVERLLVRLRPDLSQVSLDGSGALHLNESRVDGEAMTDAGMAGSTSAVPILPKQLEYYRPIKVLGQGGMGTVYLAEDTRLGREVAIKTLRPELTINADARERFLREARAAAKLEHDHIIPIYTVGEADGIPFLAMPLLRGESLDQLIKRMGGPLPVGLAVRIAREVASGLAVAHERGLIHRDIKPANIWLEAPNGRVKILDFGLAKAAEAGSSDDMEPTLTASGAIVGTPAYMAPEQASGHTVDARADLFSLGCILYEMLAGRRAFTGPNTMSILMSLAVQTPQAPAELIPDCPAGLSALVMQLLEKDPRKRPASARAFIAALDDYGFSNPHSLPVAPIVGKPIAATQPLISIQQASTSAVPSETRRSASRNRVAALIAVCLIALFGTGFVFSVQIIRIATNKGELVIEADEDIDVRIIQNGAIVKQRTSDRVFELKAVNGQVEVFEKDGVKLTTREFKLIRNGKETVKITVEELAAARNANKAANIASVGQNALAAPIKPATQPVADQANPFVLVHSNGKSREEFGSMESVISAMNDGDTIEVLGNGPFTVGAIRLQNKGLRIRAGAGYRPVFVTSKNISSYHWIDIQNGELRIEGCDLRAGPGLGYACFQGTGPAWEFRNCRLLGANVGLIGYGGPKLRFVDCLISGFTPYGNEGFGPGAATSSLEMINTIVKTAGYHLLQVPCDTQDKGDWSVNLQHNTFHVTGALTLHLNRKSFGKMRVDAGENLFQVTGVANNEVLKAIGGWHGRTNLYVGPDVLRTIPKGAKEALPGLTPWAAFWGDDEQGGQEAEWAHYAWDELRRQGHDPQRGIQVLKPVTAALAQQHGAAFKDLGPDWNLVGPGDAYVRALAATGNAVPKDQLHPEPLEEGPFVLIHEDKVVRGYPNLPEATAAAVSGDTVEIRSDEPFGTCPLKGDKPRQLTVRAAAGFQPVAEGGFDFQSKNLSLTVEGIHFRKYPLGAGLGGHSTVNAVQNTIARIANCSFASETTFTQFAGRHPRNGINGPRLEGADGKPGEIVNCLIPGIVSTTLPKDGKLHIQNSVVGNILIFAATAGGRQLELDRCVIWNPCGDLSDIEFRSTDPQKIKAEFQMSARHTLIEAGSRFILCRDGCTVTGWQGAGNAYRIGHREWVEEGQKRGTIGLSDWKLRWKSDADSVEADPLEYDPQQWRLLPSSPGYQAGADGQDLGADVSRIATVGHPD